MYFMVLFYFHCNSSILLDTVEITVLQNINESKENNCKLKLLFIFQFSVPF